MAVNTPTAAHGAKPTSHPHYRALILYACALLLPILIGLGAHVVRNHADLWQARWQLAVWTAAFAALNLLEIPTGNRVALAPGEPLGLAMCVLFPPPTALFIALIGTCEPRELASMRDAGRALSNRANAAMGAFLASAAAHSVAVQASPLRRITATLLAWITWTVVNHIAVVCALALYLRLPFVSAMRHLKVGKPADYTVTVAVWLLLAICVVLSYPIVGSWSLLMIALPALLTRQVLARSNSLVRTEAELNQHRRMLEALAGRIAAERRDERLRVAGDLHDEVVQPLFHVSLLARVVARDLATGRLAEVNDDLNHLVSSVDISLVTLRNVIGGLRASPLARRGLGVALESLAKQLSDQSDASIICNLDGLCDLDGDRQLAIYQVAREALTNAVHHSRGTSIIASLRQEDEAILLLIEDDGVGFDNRTLAEDHFGLLIMEERASSIGGSVFVDSILGRGTKVTAVFPC
jgi:signal transduction histidine kinase